MLTIKLVFIFIVLIGCIMSATSNTSWKELEGVDGEEAKQKILEENPNLNVEIHEKGGMMTMDFRTDRVRIVVDENGKVFKIPRIG